MDGVYHEKFLAPSLLSKHKKVYDEHCFAFLLALRQREKLMVKKKRQRKHKVWVRKLFRERFEKGEYYKLVLDMNAI